VAEEGAGVTLSGGSGGAEEVVTEEGAGVTLSEGGGGAMEIVAEEGAEEGGGGCHALEGGGGDAVFTCDLVRPPPPPSLAFIYCDRLQEEDTGSGGGALRAAIFEACESANSRKHFLLY
jgi:hypothetical protein